MQVYVQRVSGAIVGIYANFQEGIAEEIIDEDAPEVLAFRNASTVTQFEEAIQNLIDRTARERQFRDGVTLASYAGSTIQKWANEAQAFVAWRDNVWRYAYGELRKVLAGERPQPTVDVFIEEIAPIRWPDY